MTACAYCGSSLADDQRYCLECGGRQVVARSPFLERFTPPGTPAVAHPSGLPGLQGSAAGTFGRPPGVTVLAGLGVLLLAMGVGVLVGRAAAPRPAAAPAQVITVAAPAVGSAGSGAAGEGAPLGASPSGASEHGSSPSSSPSSSRGGASHGSSTSPSRGSSSSGAGAGSKGQGGTPKSKAPSSGESYEQKSRSLPNVVTTG
jgi:hypothetical protein